MASHTTEYEKLEKEKRAAETRQAAIEESQPEERKRLAKIKDEVTALMDARSKVQKDVGRIEAQIEMAKKSGGLPAARVAGTIVRWTTSSMFWKK